MTQLAAAGDSHVRVAGTGEPVFLFVHGFCCGKEDWDLVVERLQSQFRCVAIDLPGHGGANYGSALTIDRCAKAINDAKSDIDSDKIIVIGHSMGVKMIREAYRQSPDRVAGLVMVDGSLYMSDRQTMLNNARLEVAKGPQNLVRGLFSQMYTSSTDPALPATHLARAMNLDPDAVQSLFLDSVDWDTRFALESIAALRVAVLVLQSTTFDSNFKWQPLAKDGTTPLIDALKANVEDVEAVIIEGGGHFLMIDRADEAAEAMAAFGRRVHAAN